MAKSRLRRRASRPIAFVTTAALSAALLTASVMALAALQHP